MHIAHSNIGQPEKAAQPKKLSKKEEFHKKMVDALNRTRYQDYLRALKDPEVKELIAKAQKITPGWMPKFKVRLE